MAHRESLAHDPLKQLTALAARGNPAGVRAWVLAVGPSVLAVVRRILGVRSPEVDDVVQEALMAALGALPEFRGECTVMHFVWRVAALTAMNARRKLHVQARFASADTELDEAACDALSPLGHAHAARRRQAVRALLAELPAAQAEALALHCVLGMTVGEAAAATGVPPNTVRGRLVTAKAALRQRLAADPALEELLRGTL